MMFHTWEIAESGIGLRLLEQLIAVRFNDKASSTANIGPSLNLRERLLLHVVGEEGILQHTQGGWMDVLGWNECMKLGWMAGKFDDFRLRVNMRACILGVISLHRYDRDVMNRC